MRRRWRWQWDRDDVLTTAGIVAAAWIAGGFVVWAAIALITSDKYGDLTAAGYTTMAIWGAPFAVAGAVGLIWGLGHLVARVVSDPPLRRVAEPVREDLRARSQRDHPQP